MRPTLIQTSLPTDLVVRNSLLYALIIGVFTYAPQANSGAALITGYKLSTCVDKVCYLIQAEKSEISYDGKLSLLKNVTVQIQSENSTDSFSSEKAIFNSETKLLILRADKNPKIQQAFILPFDV